MSRRLFAVLLMIFIAASAAYAQGGAVKNSAQQGAAAVPTGKIAFIDSRAFGEGIGEMKKQLDKLEGEFQPRYTELQGMQEQLAKGQDELQKISDQKELRQRADGLERLKKDFERKREDFQADYQKRSEAVLGPMRDKVLKFLEGYAAQREIIMVFDLAPMAQAGLVFLNPGTNITDDFIKEYNKQSPSGAPTQPASK